METTFDPAKALTIRLALTQIAIGNAQNMLKTSVLEEPEFLAGLDGWWTLLLQTEPGPDAKQELTMPIVGTYEAAGNRFLTEAGLPIDLAARNVDSILPLLPPKRISSLCTCPRCTAKRAAAAAAEAAAAVSPAPADDRPPASV